MPTHFDETPVRYLKAASLWLVWSSPQISTAEETKDVRTGGELAVG